MKKLLIIALIIFTSLWSRENVYDGSGNHIGYYEWENGQKVYYDLGGNRTGGDTRSSVEKQLDNMINYDKNSEMGKLIEKGKKSKSQRTADALEGLGTAIEKRMREKRKSQSYSQPTYRYTPPVIPKCGCCQTILESTNKTKFCQPYCECKIDREKSANRLALGFLGVGLVCVLLVIL